MNRRSHQVFAAIAFLSLFKTLYKANNVVVCCLTVLHSSSIGCSAVWLFFISTELCCSVLNCSVSSIWYTFERCNITLRIIISNNCKFVVIIVVVLVIGCLLFFQCTYEYNYWKVKWLSTTILLFFNNKPHIETLVCLTVCR